MARFPLMAARLLLVFGSISLVDGGLFPERLIAAYQLFSTSGESESSRARSKGRMYIVDNDQEAATLTPHLQKTPKPEAMARAAMDTLTTVSPLCNCPKQMVCVLTSWPPECMPSSRYYRGVRGLTNATVSCPCGKLATPVAANVSCWCPARFSCDNLGPFPRCRKPLKSRNILEFLMDNEIQSLPAIVADGKVGKT